MDLNDPSLQADGLCSIRLHVAGLGSSVISSDLVQIFSSLAKVLSVDLVRSKGRNFAYVTLEAASPNLKRLFSLYNGCIWKGGRLKLEKAREFYLDKLRREWADDDCLENIQKPKLNRLTTARSLLKPKVSSGFKIYIPKLSKIKTIPEKGLGKHKRSFERVDPLPYSQLQICNCEGYRATTFNYQRRTGKSPTSFESDAKNAAVRTSLGRTSSECHRLCKETSGYRCREGIENGAGGGQKSGDAWSPNEATDVNGPALSISQGTSHAELGDDTESQAELDEPVMNITGFNESSFRKGNMEAERSVGGTKDRQQGERKRLNPDGPDAWAARDEIKPRKWLKPHPASIERSKDLGEAGDVVSQRGEEHESKAFQNPPNRSWVQKASWKSLVGETGRMTFSLGNILEQNLTSGNA